MTDPSTTWTIRNATSSDAMAAVACTVAAFEYDPHMAYLFHTSPEARRELMAEFFDILLGARLALDMPAKVLVRNEDVLGLLMGNSAAPPAWPEQLNRRWGELAGRQEGLAKRFQVSEDAVAATAPSAPHYYLGVVGVHPMLRGQGAGSALIAEFCAESDRNPASSGVLLETVSTANVAYYRRRGFEPRHQAQLDGSSCLHILFRPSRVTAHP